MNDIYNVVGKIHSIETCGTVDGPGIRYVIFMQGCHLRCLYCHNPDTWDINNYSKELTVGEIMEDILKYRSYFQASGGGVTLSGGEPLLQKEFAAALFKACKLEGLHTALDTSGHDGNINDATLEVLKYTDLVLLDIKSINADTFKKVTGATIDATLNFAQFLFDEEIPTCVRFVLVPGLTDNEDDLHEMARYLKSLKNVTKVGVLPFHQMGAYKWENLNLKYELKGKPEPTAEETEKVRKLFRSYGFRVR
ncbi:MAG: pyruvate formate-lyase-activating protein [Oscillospiraceae bacterium]|nr:pyruvate formate-lyase-activating protein [Oscillospiraceae bacterium]